MDDISPFSYICDDCGHTWNPRSENPKRSQCSKCKSRNVSKVDRAAKGVPSPLNKVDCIIQSTSQKANGKLSSIPTILADDPEIKEKLKELELVRIEKQIAETKGELKDSLALDRLISSYKVLLFNLNDNGHLTDEDYVRLASECFWCGEYDMVFEEISTEQFGWRCKKCGKLIN